MRRLLAIASIASSLLASCASPGPRVPFRVVALGDPFFGTTVTDIAVTVEENGVRDTSSITRFAPSASTLGTPPMPYGTDYALIVETELSGLVLARGRSFPFAVSVTGADHAPDVTLGVLGRFAAVGAGGSTDPYVLAMADDVGALLASPLGVTRFVAHGSDGRPTLHAPVAWPPSRVGAAFAPMGGAVLAVGGASAGASLVSSDGRVLAELPSGTLRATSGVALAAIDDTSVLAIGGATPDGTRVPDVVRIEWSGTALAATALAPIPDPRTDATALALSARSSAGTLVPRVLVLAGTTAMGDATDVVLLDPAGHAAPSATTLTTPTKGAAACALDAGLVLLAGGLDAMGMVSSQVSLLVVQPDQVPAITALAPPPPPLFHARAHAAALQFGSGLALIVGGVDDIGAPIVESELAEVHLDSLPGTVVLTGSVPNSGRTAVATRLRDHTILVSIDASLSLYFPPRGE